MIEVIVSILIISGSVFMLVAALGVFKLHDVYMRMHAITKASSLSIIFFLLALVIYYPGWHTFLGAIMIIVFIIATAPIASHMIARVSHMMGIPLSKGAVINELDKEPIIHDTKLGSEEIEKNDLK